MLIFFFQAEDGIRDIGVTGVQTCALPIFWEQPDIFDPSRFAEARRGERHRFQYIPFGGGPRLCVGARFAAAEALTILAHWTAAWRFARTSGHRVKLSGKIGRATPVTPISRMPSSA